MYAEIPSIDCQGLCRDTCVNIDMTRVEQQRIEEAGVHIPRGNVNTDVVVYACPALTIFGQCSVYEVRPLICRIWGTTKRTMCNYGCRPARWLTEPEAMLLIARAHDISGDKANAQLARLAALPENQQQMSDIRDRLNLGMGIR